MADPATFIATWLTPSSLFIVVNLVIGTIAITSRLTSTPNNQPHLVRSPSLLNRVRSFNLRPHCQPQPEPEPEPEPEPTHPQLVRKPSLLDRVSSFNLSFYKYQPSVPEPESTHSQPQLVRTPSFLQRVRSMSFSRLYRPDSIHQKQEDPDSVHEDKVEMKKSASERDCLMKCESEEEDKEAVERRRPVTAMGRVETTECREDEEVDLKADDFINRFKKQLKLQRLDSLIRYRDTMASCGRY